MGKNPLRKTYLNHDLKTNMNSKIDTNFPKKTHGHIEIPRIG